MVFIIMKLMDILREFEIKTNNTHYQDRVIQRFMAQDFFDVITINRANFNDKQIIGKYPIPTEVKDKVTRILNELEKPYYLGDPGTVFVVQLHYFDLNIRNIILTGNPYDQMINKKRVIDKNNYLTYLRERPIDLKLHTKQKLSEGFNLVCSIVDNKLTTLTFLAYANPNKIIEKNKRDFPNYKIIYIKDPFTELNNYMDIDKLKEIPNEEPQVDVNPSVANNPPVDPQLSDHDRRVLIYKQRMEKDREKKENKWKFKK
jgi:hypothetical protein